MKRVAFCFACGFVACVLFGLAAGAARADSPTSEGVTVYSVSQDDLNGDGSPDRTTILCSFATSNDRVEVYDGARDMVASEDWEQATDFDDDTWLFDVGNDGTVNLVIVFGTEGAEHIALVYDDRSGDNRVSLHMKDGRVVVDESRFWTAKIVCAGPWRNPDGSVNRNLVLSIDGPIGMPGLDTEFALSTMTNDGRVDLEVQVHTDVSADRPAYSLARSFPKFEGSIGRTELLVNLPETTVPELQGYVFWPHIGPSLYKMRGDEVPPILTVDWANSQIRRQDGVSYSTIQTIVLEAGWRIYASTPLNKGVVNHLDFENPFAFYDLAADADGWPELVVRNQYSLPGIVDCWSGGNYWILNDPKYQRQIFRYSWDQDNDSFWDYKLGLMGANDMAWIEQFPDFDIVTIPYRKLPWIVTDEMKWDAITFVQATTPTESSSEGIYDWQEIAPVSRGFMCGVGESVRIGPSDIRKTLRGEFRTKPTTTVQLYFSPIDRALHLLGADAGVYNINDAQRVRYADLDSDGFIDAWTFTERPVETGEDPTVQYQPGMDVHQVDERVLSALWATPDFLIYAGSDRISLVQSAVEASLFSTLPPRDHAEWLALGAQLERYGSTLALDDLAGMVQQFHGTSTDIAGATLDGFRRTAQSLRFVLRLAPGFQTVADDIGLGVAHLDPGAYVVTYDGAFHTTPLTPARLTLASEDWSCEPAAPERLAWVTIRATVHNEGLEDVQSLPVRLLASQEGAKPRLLVEQLLDVSGDGNATLEGNWAPPTAGAWRVWVEAGSDEGVPGGIEVGPLAEMQLDVAAGPLPEMFQPLAPSDGIRFTWPVALLLGSSALVAVCVLAIILARGRYLPAQQAEGED
jgi:hypothetical protein